MNRRYVALATTTVAAVGVRLWRERALSMSFAGRVVAITGGSRGLGLQVAREAAARGARLALLARSESELDSARDELMWHGTTVIALVCDVRSDADVTAAFARIVAELGPVDVLINCAGIIGVGPIDALAMSDYVDAIETNYLGAIRCVEAVRERMQTRRSGRIVNIGSIGGLVAIPMMLPYSGSKFALRGYSEGLHAELARDGIVVTTVSPGLMRTGSPPHGTFVGQPELEYALFAPAATLPFTSISAQAAARSILDATQRGQSEVVLSIQARLLNVAKRVAPRTTSAVFSALSGFLPRGDGRHERRLGAASTRALDRAGLGGLGKREQAAQHESLEVDSGATRS